MGTYAQQPLEHPYKIYRSADNKLYIQKSLPVYLFISTQPDAKSDLNRLDSDSTKQFVNPMYFDTEGYNTFRSPSAVDQETGQIYYPLTDVIFEVYADSRSPKTVLNYDSNQKYYNGKQLYVGKVTLELTSTDAHAGIEQILVSIDSAGYKKYTEPFVFDKEKKYSLAYYAVDNVGNAENPQHLTFTVDISAPKTELVFDGDKYEQVISGRTKIKLEAADQISGVKNTFYKIDDGKYSLYNGTLHSAYLSEGEHSIAFYSVDYVENQEAEQVYTFYVDKTPPILVDEIMGNSFVVNGKEYSSGRTKLKLTAVDNKAGVKEIKYALNQGEYQTYEKPFYLTTVSGSLSALSYAVDYVGNKSVASEKSTKSKAAYVDLTGPELKYDFEGKMFKARDTLFVNRDTRIKLEAADSESGLKALSYSLDNGAEITYDSPFAIEAEGPHVLNIYGYDNVDNSNREVLYLVVDNKGPNVYSRFSILPVAKKEVKGQMVDVYSSHAVLFLSATDAKVAIDRIFYSLNGETEKMYTGIVDGFKLGKEYELVIRAVDKLGNINIDTLWFAIDNTGPQIFSRFSVEPVGKEQIESETIDVYPSHVALFISVTNAQVAYDKIYYSINNSKEQRYQGIIDNFKAGSMIKMKIRAIDRLGNETSQNIQFKIES
ncbi:MAG: hypothetical protein CVU09_17475 [Bacteroidetes bacterium HGW-Bacteroidetes-4]|nr:MAG: hypothetical protein CVU09_17475 [Bacteroidetes bacterium HGW-Bacteroidetes-4]